MQVAGAVGFPVMEAAACATLRQVRTAMWSVEKEPQDYKSADDIIKPEGVVQALEKTKEAAKDLGRIKAILEAAKDRCFLKDVEPGTATCM